jgi:hypothetical protein
MGYLYAPGSHHTTTRIIPAARLFAKDHKDRKSHGKLEVKKLLHELRQMKNMINRSTIIDKKLVWEHYSKLCSVMVWNMRSILDRIGELDRPGSFMDMYIKNGPICGRKPIPPRKGASRDTQLAYKRAKELWMFDNKKGYKLLKNLRTHVHEITFASGEMESLFDLYTTFEYRGLVVGCIQMRDIDAIRRIATWIHARFTILESDLKTAEKCGSHQNVLFHENIQKWRLAPNYKYLKSFLLKKYVGFYNENEQNEYLDRINQTNSYL